MVQHLEVSVDSEVVVAVVRITELREGVGDIQVEVLELMQNKQEEVEALTAMAVKPLEARAMELTEEIQKMNMDT